MNAKGLNEDEVFQHRKQTGSILDFPGATDLPGTAAALELDCDVLIPAALEGVFTAENAPRIKARSSSRARTARPRPRPIRSSDRRECW